jgi:hypothetical protein
MREQTERAILHEREREGVINHSLVTGREREK